MTPNRLSVTRARRAGEGEEPLPLQPAHPLLPDEDVIIFCRVEISGIGNPKIISVPGTRLNNKHGHVLSSGQKQELVTPIGFLIREPAEVPGDSPGDEEVISAVHDPPLGLLGEPVDEVEGGGVARGDVVAPEVAGDVEAGVEGDEDGGGEGGVVGEALVLVHAVGEDDVDGELVGGVPAGVGEDGVSVVERGAEAGVGGELAHVGPEGEGLAVLEHVVVEARGEVMDVDVAAAAGVGGVGGEGELGLWLLESDGEGCVGLGAENGEVEVEEEEPEECGEGSEEAESGVRVFGGGFLHLVGEKCRHGAPSHWMPIGHSTLIGTLPFGSESGGGSIR